MRTALILAILTLLSPAACERKNEPAPPAAAAPAPTNRVDIPSAVRQNLGMTFARVESRSVARTLRLPGRFELPVTARREYRAPLAGRVELFVSQFQRVEAGTPLYRLNSPAWTDLEQQIAATLARVESMVPLREAHRVHERSLAEKVQLWQERLTRLDELRAAGGGIASQFVEARAALNATQAELADVMEKDADLQAQQVQAEAELRSLRTRRGLILTSTACAEGASPAAFSLTVCAAAPGIVESIGTTPGGAADEGGAVLTTVQPELVRFRAVALQSDLGELREGLPVRIVPPAGGSMDAHAPLAGALRLGLTADPDQRTLDLIVEPAAAAPWARAGISAHLEITLEGGRADLAIPLAAVARDGLNSVIFRRDPADPDRAIRMDADLGVSDGRWVVIASGVKEGDEVVVGGIYQLMLATSASQAKGGHFHPDGTYHEGGEH